ncbi:MAG: transglycosylase SLT domain-containing protein [Allosphingosinicella sp.]|uniref:lytic transglycosylase domain-containing protein n=1 Tax=Allosphingosinicella sp. TaxID=2823234 RepID=UPI00393BA6EB
MIRKLALAVALGTLATPALADDLDTVTQSRRARAATVPPQLSPAQRDAYSALFADLAAQNWAGALGRLDTLPEGLLHNAARAILYTAPGSPRVELEPLMTLVSRAPELPQAADLARLAQLRGATQAPFVAPAQRLIGQRGQPRRQRPRATTGDPVARELEPLIQPLIVEDQPAAAEAIMLSRGGELSIESRTEFEQRIAWSYYLVRQDREALRLAQQAARGVGDWAVHAEWVAGLAAWRLGDCSAEQSFQTVARRTGDPEMMAAGHYWASRAALRCGHPERVQPHLRAAAGQEETFYGLLAESALGLRRVSGGQADVLTPEEWASIANRPNVRAAVALAEIGQTEFADTFLRHQARIGDPREHEALTHLAARLNLTGTQMYLAHNLPQGVRIGRHDRYPAPDIAPRGGWQVDQALAYAHALQESGFRANAVSQAGARGLMQVRPGTAGDLVRWGRANADPNRLNDPATNVAFGQAYMQYLRDQSGTDGLLPRVIAAYNAGPAPVARWTAESRGDGDPLLYIESVPYWETRGYIPIVLRNYWIYEERQADQSSSRRALAQGLWPRFPGTPGPEAVRLNAPGRIAEGSD